MQKIIEDREKRRKKWIRTAKITVVTVIVLIILIRLLCSSYAFCNWYLPLASSSLGLRISADEVKFTPFSSKRHLNFRGLQVEIDDKMIFTAKRFKTKISFYELLFKQRYMLDNVRVEKASLVVSDLRRPADPHKRSGLERVRIGNVTIQDFSLRYAPEHSAFFGKAFFENVNIDSMMPYQMNTAELHSYLAWDMPDSTMVNLPVKSRIHFMLDGELFPTRLKMDVETEKLSGNIYEQDLSGLHYKALFDCRIMNQDQVLLDNVEIRQFNGEQEVFKLLAAGSYDFETQTGLMKIKADANKMRIPPIPLQYVPEDLNLNFQGTLKKEKDILTLKSDLDLDAKSIRKNGKDLIPSPKVHFNSRLTWNIFEKNLTFSHCSLEAFSNNAPLLSAKTSGNFNIAINRDSSWSFAPEDSALQVRIKDFPLSALNDSLPIQVKNGKLSLLYNLEVNAEKKYLNGTVNGTADDVEFQHNSLAFLKKHPIYFEGKLHSTGLTNITDLDITSAKISCGKNEFGALDMTGKIHFQTDEIELNGILKLDLPALLEYCKSIDHGKSEKLLACFGDCTKMNEHHIALKISSAKKIVDFTLKSQLKKLTLPQMTDAVDLLLLCQGRFTERQNQQKLKVNEFSLAAQEKFELHGSAEMLFPEGLFTSRFNVTKITPDFLRGILLTCKQGDDPPANWLRKMYYKDLTSSAGIMFSCRDRSIKISNVKLNVAQKNGGTASLVLKKPISGTLSPLKLNDVPAVATFQKFPLEYMNTITNDKCSLQILPAELDCTVDLTFKNMFRDIPFQAQGRVDQLKCLYKEKPYDFGSCKFKGEADLHDYFDNISYRNAEWILAKEGHEQIITGNGKFLLDFPFTGTTHFQIARINRKYAATFFPGATELVHFTDADSTTLVNCNFDQDYDLIHMVLDQKIKKLVPEFPKDAPEKPPVMHGAVHLDMTYRVPIQTISLNKSNIKLFDPEEKLLYHAELHGEWNDGKESKSTCSFVSDTADCRAVYLACKAVKQKNSDAPSEKQEGLFEKEKAVTAIKNTLNSTKEPGAIDLNGFSTKLNVDIRNWTYTKNITHAMTGEFSISNNVFHAKELKGKLNGAEYLLDAYADLGRKDGWDIKILWTLKNLDLVPLIKTFGGEDLKKRKISGIINNIVLSLSTIGVTNNNLDKNLVCSIQADFGKLSFPLLKEDEDMPVWQIMLMPLTIFPRIYDFVTPEGEFRKTLQKTLGGRHIDILTGEKNVELDRGIIKIQNGKERKTDLLITKLLFSGQAIQVASKEFMINPFHNQIKAVILAKFGGVVYPVKLSGSMDEPEIEKPSIIGNMLKRPLNILQKQDPVWSFEEQPEQPEKK